MIAAGFGTQAVGVARGKDPMTLGALGWIVFATVSADKMEKVQNKFSGSDTKLMGVIASGAILAAFGSFSAGHLITLDKNTVVSPPPLCSPSDSG